MTCPDCTAATTDPHWGGLHAHCHGCKVRALANGPQFWRSMIDGQQTPGYRMALVTVFGEEGAKAGHQDVKAEYARLRALRGGPP